MTSTVAPVVIGRFGGSFGVLGWIKIISFATPKDNILNFKPWLIQKNHLWKELCFEDSKKHGENIVVKISGCNSPEEAKLLTNIEIAILRQQLPKLPVDEYYWDDLIDLMVVNQEGVSLGVVKDLMATGANDVLVVVGEKRLLIPYISTVILKVDLTNKVIQVDWEKEFL